jgi:hypothetical protein
VLDLVFDRSLALTLNCRKFCDSCDALEFLALGVQNMLTDRLDVSAKENRQLDP